jgi:hypothetical protein
MLKGAVESTVDYPDSRKRGINFWLQLMGAMAIITATLRSLQLRPDIFIAAEG